MVNFLSFILLLFLVTVCALFTYYLWLKCELMVRQLPKKKKKKVVLKDDDED